MSLLFNTSNTSSLSIAQQLYAVSGKYEFYISILIMMTGLISNISILLILTRLRIFRGNQCAFYLIVECLADIGLLSTIFLSQILAHIFHTDPVNLSIIWCKIRSWTVEVFCLISLFTICFATFDQYLSTNYRYCFRQRSTLKLAHRLVFYTVCLVILHHIPILILMEIQPITGCSTQNVILQKYYSYFYYPILTAVLPVMVSGSLSLLAYRNVRRIVRQQIPIVRRRLDRQLTAMILARVICLLALGLPYILFSLCTLNISIDENDQKSLAIKRLFEAITLSLFYANYSINFYIFLAISSRFRHQVKHFLTKKCCRRLHRIAPKNPAHAVSVVDLE